MGAPAQHDFPIAVELASTATPAPAVLALESSLSCCASRRLVPALNRLLAQAQADSSATVTSSELSQYRQSAGTPLTAPPAATNQNCQPLCCLVVGEKGSWQNGYLRLNDIFNLNLPAELVVLSACQTGLGKEIKGEGLVGLTRGFMYAGSPRVAVSLW